jgi:apolipoprotein N-acyltransferase
MDGPNWLWPLLVAFIGLVLAVAFHDKPRVHQPALYAWAVGLWVFLAIVCSKAF